MHPYPFWSKGWRGLSRWKLSSFHSAFLIGASPPLRAVSRFLINKRDLSQVSLEKELHSRFRWRSFNQNNFLEAGQNATLVSLHWSLYVERDLTVVCQQTPEELKSNPFLLSFLNNKISSFYQHGPEMRQAFALCYVGYHMKKKTAIEGDHVVLYMTVSCVWVRYNLTLLLPVLETW